MKQVIKAVREEYGIEVADRRAGGGGMVILSQPPGLLQLKYDMAIGFHVVAHLEKPKLVKLEVTAAMQLRRELDGLIAAATQLNISIGIKVRPGN